MDLMEAAAQIGMGLKAAQFQQSYSVALQKKAMETQELAMQELVEMMPEAPAVPKGEFIDVYA